MCRGMKGGKKYDSYSSGNRKIFRRIILNPERNNRRHCIRKIVCVCVGGNAFKIKTFRTKKQKLLKIKMTAQFKVSRKSEK